MELVTQVRSLIERVLGEATTREQVVSTILVAFFNSAGTHNLVTALANCEVGKIDDVIQAVYRCYEVFGKVILVDNHGRGYK